MEAHTRPAHLSFWRLITSGARPLEITVLVGTMTLLVVVGTLGGVAQLLRPGVMASVAFWIVVITLVEFLQVVAWRNLQVSTGFPLFTAVAFLFPPWISAAVGFIASSDPREIRGEVRVMRALFNRSQISLAQFVASLTFHELGGDVREWSAALAGPLAVLAAYIVNAILVSSVVSLDTGLDIRSVMRHLRIGNPLEFLVSYVGLGFLGVLLARLYVIVGGWAIAAFTLPLLLVRQMFFRTRALEEATQELRDREVVLRALSNRMAEERHDERQQIAGYLHDDLAQLLYRMSLHLDIAEQRLRRGQVQELDDELDALRSARDAAQEMVRALIRDLHRSPLGRAGLVQTLASYFLDVERDTGVPIKANLEDIDMPPPVQLLCYHVTREAVMNAVKHGRPSAVEVSLEAASDGARVTIRDDGKGFDPDEGSPEGHFGLKMMKERALVAGGTFKIDSAPGAGTTVIAEFPTSWLAEAPALRGAAPDGQP